MFKTDEQISETLKSVRCIMESVEWCSVDEVKCLLSYLTGEKKMNLDNIQQVPCRKVIRLFLSLIQ